MKTDTATISLTNRCNFHCKHCSVNAGKKLNKELKLKEIISLLNELKKLHVKKIELSGGEPLLIKNLNKIIKHAKKLNFKVKILTNGLLLSKYKIKKFEKLGLDAIAISLDGINYKTFNKIRPISKNNFSKVLKNIRLASQSNIFLKINTVVTKSSVEEIQEIINFCDKLKIKELRICFFSKIGRGSKLNEEVNSDYWISKIKELKSKFTKVYVGLSYSKFKSECLLNKEIPIYISSVGNVHACPLLNPLGNIRKNKLKEILMKKSKSCLHAKKDYKNLYQICPLRKFSLEEIK